MRRSATAPFMRGPMWSRSSPSPTCMACGMPAWPRPRSTFPGTARSSPTRTWPCRSIGASSPTWSEDLAPYRRLIANGLPGVMVAHILFPAVDAASGEPLAALDPGRAARRAALSRRGVRRRLSMGGAAAAGDIVTRVPSVRSRAGCDMLPVCNDRAGGRGAARSAARRARARLAAAAGAHARARGISPGELHASSAAGVRAQASLTQALAAPALTLQSGACMSNLTADAWRDIVDQRRRASCLRRHRSRIIRSSMPMRHSRSCAAIPSAALLGTNLRILQGERPRPGGTAAPARGARARRAVPRADAQLPARWHAVLERDADSAGARQARPAWCNWVGYHRDASERLRRRAIAPQAGLPAWCARTG